MPVSISARGAQRLKLADPARADAGFQRLLIRWAPGIDRGAALERLGGDELEATVPGAPSEVTRLRGVRSFPAAIAATLVILGAIAGAMGVASDASHPLRQFAFGAVLLVLAFNLIAAVPAWTALAW